MKKIVWLSICFICLLSLPLRAEVVPLDTIPFELGADNRLYVTVYINELDDRPLRFLLDTGCSIPIRRALKGWLPLREVWRTVAPIRWKPFLQQNPRRW